jgi:hypothetical protein
MPAAPPLHRLAPLFALLAWSCAGGPEAPLRPAPVAPPVPSPAAGPAASPAGPPSGTPSGTPQAPPGAPAGDPTPASICQQAAAEHARTLARLAAGPGSAAFKGGLGGLPPLLGRCLPLGNGAWVFRLDALCEVDPVPLGNTSERPTVAGRWSVVHVDHKGRPRVHVPGGSTTSHRCVGGGEVWGNILGASGALGSLFRFDEPLLFDYDGDGSPELLLRVSTRNVEESLDGGAPRLIESAAVRVLAIHGVEMEDFKLVVDTGFTPWLARDIDGDGRPDLLGAALLADDPRMPWEPTAPGVFARSLPGGTFSVLDPAAAGATLEQCPRARPPLVVRSGDGTVDQGASVTRLLCERLRGASPAALAKRVAAGCKGVEAQCASVLAAASRLEEVPSLSGTGAARPVSPARPGGRP